VAELEVMLGLSRAKTEAVVAAFEEFVVQPMQARLERLKGRDLAKRNPMIYTVRGATSTEEWIDWVLQDKETSAIEGLLGTWQEEVARIVSGGIKPASGVDLQVDDVETVELFAIQTAPNTKNAGGSRHDLDALKRTAAVLRAQRRHVRCYVAVLCGRSKTAELPTSASGFSMRRRSSRLSCTSGQVRRSSESGARQWCYTTTAPGASRSTRSQTHLVAGAARTAYS
jgi:hypothetical protein